MNITVAIDSFKGSLSTFESGQAVKEAALAVYPDACVNICPLADGGEGTVDAIVSATGGTRRTVRVTGPLGAWVDATYGILPDAVTAVIEMSAAAGITLIASEERDPLLTTTYGVGEMIADAIANGCRKFIVGIGGSATNDGGVGMLQALGFAFLDADGMQVSLGARGLERLCEIRCDGAMPELTQCTFCIACDVENPLCGERGCSAVYGPQKGATPQMILDMDAWLERYAQLTAHATGTDYAAYPGAGAAGGIGFAFLSYLGGKTESGISLVMRATGLEEHLRDCDIVITGEGRLDGQSCMGKAPVGVARAAKMYGKPVIAFCGCASDDAYLCHEHGIDAIFPILRAPISLSEAMDVQNAYHNLKTTAQEVFCLMRCLERSGRVDV